MSDRISLGRRAGRALVLVVAVSVLTSPAILAGDPTIGVDGSSGSVGDFGYIESEADPAGRCRYGYVPDGEVDPYNGVRKVAVRPPTAFARAGRASQRIAWRLTVQAWDGAASHWVAYSRTRWLAKRATPSSAAPFTGRGLLVDSWPHHGEYGAYRAKVELRWYGSDDATIVGRARLFPDHYRGFEDGVEFAVLADDCWGTTG